MTAPTWMRGWDGPCPECGESNAYGCDRRECERRRDAENEGAEGFDIGGDEREEREVTA